MTKTETKTFEMLVRGHRGFAEILHPMFREGSPWEVPFEKIEPHCGGEEWVPVTVEYEPSTGMFLAADYDYASCGANLRVELRTANLELLARVFDGAISPLFD